MHDILVPYSKLPVRISRITLCRWLASGRFPAPAATICTRRYWRLQDVEAWMQGKREGWPRDAEADGRRNLVLERTHGNAPWAMNEVMA